MADAKAQKMTPRETANKAALEALKRLTPGPDVLKDLGIHALDNIAGLIQNQINWERANACVQVIFFEEMLKTTPKWRWVARIHFKRKLRRARARCKSNELSVCRGGTSVPITLGDSK
jgi:hypothetical protein